MTERSRFGLQGISKEEENSISDGEGTMDRVRKRRRKVHLVRGSLLCTWMTLLAVTFLAGCSARSSRTNVGVGVSKTPGQKAKVNVGVSQNVGGKVNVGVSTSR